jgi:hypothetical protein
MIPNRERNTNPPVQEQDESERDADDQHTPISLCEERAARFGGGTVAFEAYNEEHC